MFRFGIMVLFFIIVPLYSQNIGPVIQGEKRPTTKAPSYKPSLIPFFLRKETNLNPAQSFLINPEQTPESLLKPKKKTSKRAVLLPEEEMWLKRIHKDPKQEEYYIKKYFLPQLGYNFEVDLFTPYLPGPQYEEGKWERRWNIFMLSFPVTTSLSYGILKLYKRNRNQPSYLNHQESIGIFFAGVFFSLWIVYYDEYYNHYEIETYSHYLKKNSP